jgi:DinB superfamily
MNNTFSFITFIYSFPAYTQGIILPMANIYSNGLGQLEGRIIMKSVNENLVETRNRLFNEINLLSYEELNKKPDENTWSIAQVCHHVSLTEKAFTKAIVYGLKQSKGTKVEPKPIQRVTDRSQKVQAPEIVIPGNDPLEALQINELLNESRNILLDMLSQIEDPTVLSERSASHRLFGTLPLTQWVELVYLHEKRHIEQIKEIKSLIL